MVFCSHEADLLHILVGGSNERLTGTESVVEMLTGGGGRKGHEVMNRPHCDVRTAERKLKMLPCHVCLWFAGCVNESQQ